MARAPKKRTESAKSKTKRSAAKTISGKKISHGRISARKKDLDKKKTFLRNGKRPSKFTSKKKPMNFKNTAERRKKGK